MNKNNEEYAILRVKKPNSCSECELCSWQDIQGEGGYNYCPIVDLDKHDIGIIHPQCPLQDTKELLEALEELGKYYSDFATPYKYKIGDSKLYKKLYNILGGNDE